MDTDTSLVAVTSYFNPARYESRYKNYLSFRERLKAPLLTVELVFDGSPELQSEDADFLVQVQVGDVLWQKERLLNLGLRALPKAVAHVAILDCDVVFLRDDWADATIDALKTAPLVQPYSEVWDVGRDTDLCTIQDADILLRRASFAKVQSTKGIDLNSIRMDASGQFSPGHAWAARREVLCDGLYDGMILGSGDLAWAAAAVGGWDGFLRAFGLGPAHADHYRTWAKQFHRRISGNLGYVNGSLVHLWHGNLDDRAYGTRYSSIKDFDFDPSEDIRHGPNDAWTWSTQKNQMHRVVAEYFNVRREDGSHTDKPGMRSVGLRSACSPTGGTDKK